MIGKTLSYHVKYLIYKRKYLFFSLNTFLDRYIFCMVFCKNMQNKLLIFNLTRRYDFWTLVDCTYVMLKIEICFYAKSGF